MITKIFCDIAELNFLIKFNSAREIILKITVGSSQRIIGVFWIIVNNSFVFDVSTIVEQALFPTKTPLSIPTW